MTRSGQLALPKVLKWSGGPPGCPGMVRTPSWMSESGRVALSNVTGVFGRPYRMSGRTSQMYGSD